MCLCHCSIILLMTLDYCYNGKLDRIGLRDVRCAWCVPWISWFNPLILINVFCCHCRLPSPGGSCKFLNAAVSNYYTRSQIILHFIHFLWRFLCPRTVEAGMRAGIVVITQFSAFVVGIIMCDDGISKEGWVSHGSNWMASCLINPNWMLSKSLTQLNVRDAHEMKRAANVQLSSGIKCKPIEFGFTAVWSFSPTENTENGWTHSDINISNKKWQLNMSGV